VRGLGRDASDTAIVKSVIDLAHALGLVVVAEGVEDPDQVAHLRKLGCDLAQGYFFARPQPAEDLERWFDRRRGCDKPCVAGATDRRRDLEVE
jgi:EAL domain-containing protein (putative c-di-GMP-specific phosphodiesterase class I)